MVWYSIQQEFISPLYVCVRESVCVRACVCLRYAHGCTWMCIKSVLPLGDKIISWDRTKSIWKVRQSPLGAGHQRLALYQQIKTREGERGDFTVYIYRMCVCMRMRERECKDKRGWKPFSLPYIQSSNSGWFMLKKQHYTQEWKC